MQTTPHTSPLSAVTDAPDLPLGPELPAWKPAAAPERAPLAGLRARLEPLNVANHAVSLHAANAADSAGRMWTYLPYGPFADAVAYADWVRSQQASPDPLFFAIVEAATGSACGVAAYLRIDPNNGCIEIGHLAFAPRLQRTPTATEALFLMLDHAFAWGYRRVEWKCNALNAPSRQAAQRLGFRFEGLFRQAAVVKGRNRDTAWYAMLDHEWPALRLAYIQWLDAANFDAQGQQRLALGRLTQLGLASLQPAVT
ncbi:MAG: GNAT family N-acetyltransferase [Betaproteobacteria bacterium]|nr:GNAT family N-acetyltransferase [Betaproteobacteria bacterium]MDE2124149.1 GNAT family N-acetyltransferase [Betaproteobacteria bacterium]MDE2186356.1 GNAT family N-acetyltransferase [Betaproteobacteria bacterium]MDE2325690.1 GNAT family N-acetyltransferase [Betaproteobacteria bacterium]